MTEQSTLFGFMTHLCQYLPRNNDDLHRLKGNVPSQTLGARACTTPDLPRCHVQDHSNGNAHDHQSKNDGEQYASCAVGALAANETEVRCVPVAADGAIYS